MLHLGTARTALFCWAFARHHGGTVHPAHRGHRRRALDQEAVQVILDAMKWLDLDYDEGPVRQIERLARYREVVDRLLAEGKAYHCYASKEELDAMREQQMARGEKPRYDGRWRPENARGKTPPAGVTPVVRFRNPDDRRGGVERPRQGADQLRQQRARRPRDRCAATAYRPTTSRSWSTTSTWRSRTCCAATTTSTTRRARSTSTARSSAPSELPRFGHLPMILGADGQKLSKRHGAVSVLQYDEDWLPARGAVQLPGAAGLEPR